MKTDKSLDFNNKDQLSDKLRPWIKKDLARSVGSAAKSILFYALIGWGLIGQSRVEKPG